jgi:hypothetical protein
VCNTKLAEQNPRRIQINLGQQSLAIQTALAHCEAWSNQDWDKARRMLAPT